MPQSNNHVCDLKIEFFALQKLAPNAPWYQRCGRCFQKWLTLDPELPITKRFFRNRSSLKQEQQRHLNGAAYVIHPFSKVNRIRQALLSILWITEMILAPIDIWFIHIIHVGFLILTLLLKYLFGTHNNFSLWGTPYWTHKFYRNVLSTMITVMNMFHFFTGYVDKDTNSTIIEPTKVVKHYLLTYFFTDFLYNPKYLIYDEYSNYMQLMNLLCFIRIKTCYEYLENIFLSFKIREVFNVCIKLITITGLLINVFTCAYYGLPAIFNKGEFTADQWQMVEDFVPHRDALSRHIMWKAYSESFVVVCCNFFGAGEGPLTNRLDDLWQKGILIVVMITGRMWTLYTLATILKLFSVINISASKYEENYMQLDGYMKLKKLPQNLRKKIKEYYSYKFQNQFFNEPAILNTLSSYLKEDLLLYESRKVMNQVELFQQLPKPLVGAIIASCKQNVYMSGEVICAEGELCEKVFFISSGSLAVTKEEKELLHIGDGDQIGCRIIFIREKYRYTFSYTAIETTEIFSIDLKLLRRLVSRHMDNLRTTYMRKLENTYALKVELARKRDDHESDLLRELDDGLILEHRRVKLTI